MSITARKITTTTALKGGPKEGYLPVHSVDFNKAVDDLTALDAANTTLTDGTADLSVDTIVTAGTTSLGGLLLLTGTPQTLTGAGAVNLTTKVTLLVTTGAQALTLAAGTDGQVKIITMKTDGGDGTLTPTGLRGGTTITFSAVGQSATLIYKDSAWIVLSLVGAVLA